MCHSIYALMLLRKLLYTYYFTSFLQLNEDNMDSSCEDTEAEKKQVNLRFFFRSQHHISHRFVHMQALKISRVQLLPLMWMVHVESCVSIEGRIMRTLSHHMCTVLSEDVPLCKVPLLALNLVSDDLVHQKAVEGFTSCRVGRLQQTHSCSDQ